MKTFNKIIDILKSKWLKNTGRTAILIALIIVIFLAINVIMLNIDPKDIDLTTEKLYSLSKESEDIISKLPEEDKIEIYMFDYKDQDAIVELVKQYTKINKNISVKAVDTSDRPDLVSKYNIESGYNTVLLISGDKFKMFTAYDFYNYDYNTNNTTDITEQRITNGIIAISSIGKVTPIYILKGHEEKNANTEMRYLSTYLELENYELKELDLLSEQNIPEDCSSLMIASPKKDFADIETEAIKKYIEKGGNILWLNDPYSASVETPNIKSILDIYGVTLRQDGFIMEQDKSKMIMGTPDLVIPEIQYSELTEGLSSVLLLGTGKLEFSQDLESLGVTKTDLLKTSDKSFFRTNIEQSSLTPVEGENQESNVTASILEKKINDEGTNSKLVIFANNMFITDRPIYVDSSSGTSAIPAIAFYENVKLAMQSIEYVSEVEDPITIRKPIETTQYTATETQDIIIRTIIFSFPVIIVIVGIIVWQVRRRKK